MCMTIAISSSPPYRLFPILQLGRRTTDEGAEKVERLFYLSELARLAEGVAPVIQTAD